MKNSKRLIERLWRRSEGLTAQENDESGLKSTSEALQAGVWVKFKFLEGPGTAKATLLRKGEEINFLDFDESDQKCFTEAQIGDTISISGNCATKASLEITANTEPQTPIEFDKGRFGKGFDII